MEHIEKTRKNLGFFYIGFPFPRFSTDASDFSTRFDETMRVCLTINFFQFHNAALPGDDLNHLGGLGRSLKPL
jgi:hypothetical protein